MHETPDGNGLPPELVAAMAAMAGRYNLKIPPPIFVEMQGTIDMIDIPNKRLVARYPVQARYQNPLGMMQGGMIAAAIDNTLGPLSFLIAPPSVTRRLEVRYVRPVTADQTEITAEAQVTAQTERELVIEVDVRNADGQLMARGKATHVILSDEQIAQMLR